MDKQLISRGTSRTSLSRFFLWILPWAIMLAVGLYAVFLCLSKGLNQTNMDNRYSFGLWIYLDLTVIALGAGAFFTGFLFYILKRKELSAVINSAVVIGFICYSGAASVIAIDVGQPLRLWFTFWHPNVHSMLTEVSFCITCYLVVLIVEYIPILLKNRKIKKAPTAVVVEFELHKLMIILAAVGTFLSFFHQGSLGGLYGVLVGRPFAFRPALGIWPTTFFLFIISAAAVGPSFILLTTWIAEKFSRKQLVKPEVLQFLGKVSGSILIFYVILKSVDTIFWINTVGSLGFSPASFFRVQEFGTWILFLEIIILGLVPAILLLSKRVRGNTTLLVLSATMACAGIALNRYVMTIQTLALPTMPFDKYFSYSPSWQEIAAFLAVLSYGMLIYSFSFRYLTLFPQEQKIHSI